VARPLSLYVHVPFCTVKCGYCDFNAYAGQEGLMAAYAQALVREGQLWGGRLSGRSVSTVFFGGGTPSLLPVEILSTVMAGLRDAFDIEPHAEVSLEANPDGLDESHLRGLRGLGVTRLSLGMQSFDDDELHALDRLHSAADNVAAFGAARAAGFHSISMDLIFGLPGQPLPRWQASLERAIALGPDHLSLYALTVEEGTPLARDVVRGRTPAPDPDAQAEQYECAEARLETAGYEHYEISSWARPGHRCRHNETYWRCGEYLGLGAGAHSYLGRVRFANAATPARYVELVEQSWAQSEPGGGLGQIASCERVTEETARADALTLGLRLLEGVDRPSFRGRFRVDPLDLFGERLREPIEAGLLEVRGERLLLTSRGRLLANEVAVRLLPD